MSLDKRPKDMTDDELQHVVNDVGFLLVGRNEPPTADERLAVWLVTVEVANRLARLTPATKGTA